MTNIGPNPFTPKSGMEPKIFLGRENALKIFIKSLEQTRQGYFDHFTILGDWGVGKTTLLKEFKKIAQSQGVLTSLFSVREFTNRKLISPTIHLITQIPRNLPVKISRFKRFRDYLNGLGISFPIIGGGIQFPTKLQFQGDPQILLLESLLQIWEEIKNETRTLFVLIDDIQNLHNLPEFMTILKNVLSDEDIISKTGFLFILSSTIVWWRQFMKKHHPIGRYFVPMIRLKNLTRTDVESIIKNSLENTGVYFYKDVINKIYEYTEGHPFQLQVLCNSLYENQINGIVTIDTLDIALENTLQYFGEIMLENLYEKASENEKILISQMANNYKDYTIDELSRALNTFKSNEIRTMLLRLTEKRIIQKVSRGKYRLPSRMFFEFIRRK